ncbi:MAG: Rpn family recombination-promoting nuclease/putative transposase, partial [Planctomycetaceae bacterium]|nr:Rpn family recombination-promoting nuclease/putative transposase [Planctomycetaceae bacterium]
HDRFTRKTVGNPIYAGDFLKNYANPELAEFVDLDNLKIGPTHYLTQDLRESVSDIAFCTQLIDNESDHEIIIVVEHKSTFTQFAGLQAVFGAIASSFMGWVRANYAENYKPSIPLACVMYNGNENINEDIFLQEVFGIIPPKLRQFVPQCKIFLVNLQRFDYGKLPGNLSSQVIAESLKRGCDETFGNNLGNILHKIKIANLVRQQKWDLVENVARYCSWRSNLSSKQLVEIITTVFNNKEDQEMVMTLQKGIIREGYDLGIAEGKMLGKTEGVAEGELKARINDTLDILWNRFGNVPQYLVDALHERTDTIAMRSLIITAATCKTLDEFESEL